MDFVLFAVALAVLFFGGWGTAMLVCRKPEEPIYLIGLSCLLGSAVITLSLFLIGIMVRGPIVGIATALVAVVIGVVGVRQRPKTLRTLTRPELVCLLFIACQSVAVIWLAWRTPHGWDGFFVWEMKARAICLNRGGVPFYYFSDLTRVWSHPRYPLHVPFLETWFYGAINGCRSDLGKVATAWLYFPAACLVFSLSKQWTGRLRNGVFSTSLLFTLPVAITGGGERDVRLCRFRARRVVSRGIGGTRRFFRPA